MQLSSVVTGLVPVLSVLAFATLIETVLPLRSQVRWERGRVATNLLLMLITLALGLLLNALLALGSAYVTQNQMGVFQLLQVRTTASFVVTLLVLDGASYAVHRLMHATPALWRVHVVHHMDVAVDSTTAFRQHPVEGVLRFAFIALAAWTLGAPPAAIALYRLLGSLNSIVEHANIRVPRWLDRLLVYIWVTPHMHKVHHSRVQVETDSNYANLFSFFDRLFGTFTPSDRGVRVEYGIAGYDAPEQHSIGAVLRLPFRRPRSAMRMP